MNPANSQLILKRFLLGWCVLLIAIFIYETTIEFSLPVPPAISIQETPLVGGDIRDESNPSTLPEGSTYTEIVDRPLFYVDRLPLSDSEPPAVLQEQSTPPGANPVVEEALSLSAITITDDLRLALVQKARSKKLIRTQVGDVLDGWKVEDIQAESVTLKKGAQEKKLLLEIKPSSFKPRSAPPEQTAKPK